MSWWNNAPWADVSGEEGVPIGGLTGQVLAKKSDNERDVEWVTVATGEDGNSIVSVELTETVGLVDTYTITYTDIASTTFDVTNGEDGTNGVGIPEGGDAGQVLSKVDGTNYNTTWKTLILYGTGDAPSAVGVADGVLYLKYEV